MVAEKTEEVAQNIADLNISDQNPNADSSAMGSSENRETSELDLYEPPREVLKFDVIGIDIIGNWE